MLRTWKTPYISDVPEIAIEEGGLRRRRSSKKKRKDNRPPRPWHTKKKDKPRPFNLTQDDMDYLKKNTHYDEATIRYEKNVLSMVQTCETNEQIRHI